MAAVERLEHHDHREATDELGHQPERDEVVSLDRAYEAGFASGRSVQMPCHGNVTAGHDGLYPRKRAAADEEDVLRIEARVVLAATNLPVDATHASLR